MATILVVDDDLNVQATFGIKLRQQGYSVLYADSGNTGMSVAQKEKPDLILLDMLLPGDGVFQFLKKLRATPSLAKTKVIVLSNLLSDNANEHAKALGVSDYLLKSDLSLDNLLKIVKQRLEPPATPASP